jgi:hypothetical protein
MIDNDGSPNIEAKPTEDPGRAAWCEPLARVAAISARHSSNMKNCGYSQAEGRAEFFDFKS